MTDTISRFGGETNSGSGTRCRIRRSPDSRKKEAVMHLPAFHIRPRQLAGASLAWLPRDRTALAIAAQKGAVIAAVGFIALATVGLVGV